MRTLVFSWVFLSSMIFVVSGASAADEAEMLKLLGELKSRLTNAEYSCKTWAAAIRSDKDVCHVHVECENGQTKKKSTYGLVCAIDKERDCSKLTPCLEKAILTQKNKVEKKIRPLIGFIAAHSAKADKVVVKNKCEYLSADKKPEAIIIRASEAARDIDSTVICTTPVSCSSKPGVAFAACEPDDYDISEDGNSFNPVCPLANSCVDKPVTMQAMEMKIAAAE